MVYDSDVNTFSLGGVYGAGAQLNLDGTLVAGGPVTVRLLYILLTFSFINMRDNFSPLTIGHNNSSWFDSSRIRTRDIRSPA